MRQPQDIAREETTMNTIVQLTSVFEGIASMRIAQIKNQVMQSQQFFNELWGIYRQLRVDEIFRSGRDQNETDVINKELLIVITSEGSFSGDIDQKLIKWVLQHYNKDKQDIIVIGHHGAIQLVQAGVQFKKYYKLPARDQNINVEPITRDLQQYRTSTVYYQTYVSLMVQDVKRIELGKVVQEKGKNVDSSKELISDETYIFEPSTFAVIGHLERSMMQIALGQVILESKLAQYASRFRAMSLAHTKAKESHEDLHMLFNRSKRSLKDERLKEIINGLKKERFA